MSTAVIYGVNVLLLSKADLPERIVESEPRGIQLQLADSLLSSPNHPTGRDMEICL